MAYFITYMRYHTVSIEKAAMFLIAQWDAITFFNSGWMVYVCVCQYGAMQLQ